MKNNTALLLCVLCAVFAFLILGVNYFALYQLLPILVFYGFQVKVFNQFTSPASNVCYALAVLILLLFPLLAQISWYFDWNDLASKSSTSGLLFVWLPMYALLPGIVPCLVAWILKAKAEQKR